MFSGGLQESIGKYSVTPFQLSVAFHMETIIFIKYNRAETG